MIHAGFCTADNKWHIGYLNIEHDRYFITTTRKLEQSCQDIHLLMTVQRGTFEVDKASIVIWNGEIYNV